MKFSVALLGIAAMVAFGIANAQRLPTDVELKAAYCLSVTQGLMNQTAQMMTNLGVPPEKQTDAFKDQNERVNRLKLYLLPRLQELEMLSVTSALKRGETDAATYFARMSEVQNKCQPSCPALGSSSQEYDRWQQCMLDCIVARHDEFIERIKSCSRLDWLPF